MSSWKGMCRGRDLHVEGDTVTVTFGDDRSHRIAVAENPVEFLLRAIVARPAIVRALGSSLAVTMWLRNRAVSLVGFEIDQRDRLVCTAFVPKAGLSAEEFQFQLRMVALESDRFEYALTGRDVE